MDNKIFEEGFRKVIENIYSAESIFKRAKIYLSATKPVKVKNELKRKLTLQDILLGFRLIYFLGIKDNNRRYFWQMLYWLYRNKKLQYSELAVLFVALIYQYKMMWKRYINMSAGKE